MKDLVFENTGARALVNVLNKIQVHSQSGITFFNTSSMKCFKPLGYRAAYATSVVGGAEMKKNLVAGPNRSDVHVGLATGSSQMDTMVTVRMERVPLPVMGLGQIKVAMIGSMLSAFYLTISRGYHHRGEWRCFKDVSRLIAPFRTILVLGAA